MVIFKPLVNFKFTKLPKMLAKTDQLPNHLISWTTETSLKL